jgi:uncharacterized protein
MSLSLFAAYLNATRYSLSMAAWYFFMNTVLLSAVIAFNFRFFSIDQTAFPDLISWWYLPAAVIGWSLVLSLIPFLLQMLVVLLLPWEWLQRLIATISWGLLLIATLVSGQIYSLYRFHLDPFFIDLFFNNFETFDFSVTTLILQGIFVVLIFLFLWFLPRCWKKWIRGRFIKLRTFMYVLMVGCLISGQIIHAFAFDLGKQGILSVTPVLPWYQPLKMGDDLRRWGLIDQHAKAIEVPNAGAISANNFIYPKTKLQCEAIESPNILLITLESWRFDAFNANATPFLFDFSKRTLNFNNHYSNGNVTIKGLFSLLYGLNPSYWDAVESSAKKPELLSVLQNKDYLIQVLANQNLQRDGTQRVIYNGFDIEKPTGYGGTVAGDKTLTEDFVSFLNQSEAAPWFTHLIYNATHHPYRTGAIKGPLQPAKKIEMALLNINSDATPFFNQYQNAAWVIDQHIKNIVETLESQQTLENTIVIITSDHGEEFNDNGENYWGHGSNFTKYQLSVPLLMYWKGKHADYSHQTTHTDIVPTLLEDVFQCQNEIRDYSDGKNLFDNSERSFIASSYINSAFIQGESVSAMLPGFIQRYSTQGTNISVDTALDMQAYIEAQGRFRK